MLASADILDDLVLLGALDERVAVGTMNRGGLAGAAWELDDRFTAYDADHLCATDLDAGKMLLRIDYRATPAPCRRSPRAPPRWAELNDRRMMAMVEPIPYTKDASGKAVWDDDPDALLKAVGVCAALGHSSAYTWLKIQATANIDDVASDDHPAAADARRRPGTRPGGDRSHRGRRALAMPSVRGLVVGRSLLYPADGDVDGAVARAADHRADAGCEGEAMTP